MNYIEKMIYISHLIDFLKEENALIHYYEGILIHRPSLNAERTDYIPDYDDTKDMSIEIHNLIINMYKQDSGTLNPETFIAAAFPWDRHISMGYWRDIHRLWEQKLITLGYVF